MQVAEIFQSVDGEVNPWGQGRLSTFIRTSQCNLRCRWCDTPQSKVPGVELLVDEIFEKIQKLGCHKVTITGGEPLVQMEGVLQLIDLLLKYDYKISVETNGSIVPPLIYFQDKWLSWIFDYKLEFPEKMQIGMMANILSSCHWIKIVIEGENDYKEAIRIKNWLRQAGSKASFAFSPAAGIFGRDVDRDEESKFMLSPHDLVDWLIRDLQWDVAVNIQMHKLLSVR